MPKNKTAQKYDIEETRISVDDANQITAYAVQVNVDYAGTNVREQYDLWPVANAVQKAHAQALQNLVRQYLEQQILG